MLTNEPRWLRSHERSQETSYRIDFGQGGYRMWADVMECKTRDKTSSMHEWTSALFVPYILKIGKRLLWKSGIKRKVVLVHGMKAYRGRSGFAPLILKLSNICERSVSHTSRPSYVRAKETSVPTEWVAGWTRGSIWSFGRRETLFPPARNRTTVPRSCIPYPSHYIVHPTQKRDRYYYYYNIGLFLSVCSDFDILKRQIITIWFMVNDQFDE